MSISTVLSDILEREGWPAYTEHPNDKGGPTKGGITIRTLEAHRHRRCTRTELKRLTEEEALAILRRRYVEVQGINTLSDGDLQEQVIDNGVLSGPDIAVKDLQRAIASVLQDMRDEGVVGDHLGFRGVLKVDGIIGPKTNAAIAGLSPAVIGRRLAVERALRLARIVAKEPDQSVFLVGWLTRALSFIR